MAASLAASLFGDYLEPNMTVCPPLSQITRVSQGMPPVLVQAEDIAMAPSETNNLIAKKVAWYEAGAILFVIVLSWFDEVLDIPHVLLGGAATPINWRESVFESVIIAIVGGLIIRHTYRLLARVSYLESFLPVCASCKKIRLDPEFWEGIRIVVQERAKKEFTHGICPDCIEKYYPELRKDGKVGTRGTE